MIRKCAASDFINMLEIINDAAKKYGGVIPVDCYRAPYMLAGELKGEIDAGVIFYGYLGGETLLGVMGLQDVSDVTLIRHAYVTTKMQGRGIGSQLLKHLLALTDQRVLIGIWADAAWAVRFYEKHGFKKVTPVEKDRLLRKYWKITERQIETSVVLTK